MTFLELIKKLSPDQVNFWWESQAPEKAPEIKDKNNWKYNLTKYGKVLPFKWTVEEIAKYYQLEYSAKNFTSNLANRDAFCDAFDFQIQEDLVYDNTELSNFKKLYSKIPHNYHELFQSFTGNLSNLISVNQVNPYKIRMALRNSGTEAMVIVGMRATQAFSIKNNKAFMTLMIHESMLNVVEPTKVISKEQFTGKDADKWLMTFEVEAWNSIPENILASNADCFKQEYISVKDSKRATWNSEANTTNSAFKYVAFKNENVQDFVNQNKKIVTEYFNIEEIYDLRDEHNENVREDTFKKLEYLKDELSKVTNVGFSPSERYFNPKNQYLDIGFNTAKNSDSSVVIILGFFGDDENEVFFKLKVDSKEEFESEEIININETSSVNIVHGEFPESWKELIKKLETPIEEITKALTPNISNTNLDNVLMQQPLNQILYGPPGTGKTYNTINQAITIANPHFDLNQGREILKAEYDRLVEAGQIVFTTFHQSMSYEDFIEGIKPQIEEDSDGNKNVIYEIKDGVFKLISSKAQERRLGAETVNHQFTFEDAWGSIVNEANIGLDNNNPLQLTIQTPNLGLKIVDVTEKGNLKLKPMYSEEAKEYIVSYSRTKILQEAFPDLSVIKNIDKEFREVIGGSNSTAYWSVINYINNKINSEKKSTTQEKVLPTLPHVLIIDEINRGNVSQIFGELITLIEEGKRIGNSEELQVTLPYSKKKFGVPSNLYIIGTMNTADRSVEALDTALRRRFSFVEMMPDLSIIEKENFQDYLRVDIMQKINQRIELLLDRNYTLGHSYFIKEDFKASFKNEIIPLLQEYFYNDYGKIGLILGQGFVREKEISKINHQTIFADFDTRNEIEVIKSYELIPFEEIDFENALERLLA